MKTNVLAVSISRLYDRYVKLNGCKPSGAAIYEMARWAWRSRKAESCRIVFACLHGRVEGVFAVRKWFSCGKARTSPELRPCAPQGSLRYKEIEDDVIQDRRMAFVGSAADCAQKFISKDAPRLYGPIGYVTVNC